jgi:RHS repeat-associated protein
MGFYAKDEPAQPTDGRSVAGTLSRARKPRSQNAIPSIFTVGIGHRFYNPGLGRWVSRDPIDEEGGLNLSSFVSNDPTHRVDLLGQRECGVIVWIGHMTRQSFFGPNLRDVLNRPEYKSDGECVKHAAFGCDLSSSINYDEPHIVPGQPVISAPIGGQEHAMLRNRKGDEWWLNYQGTAMYRNFYSDGMSYEDFSNRILTKVLENASMESMRLAGRLKTDSALRNRCCCSSARLVVKVLWNADVTTRERAIIKRYEHQPSVRL